MDSSINKTIVIAGIFTFPTGMAASARMRNLAHGFIANGYNVKIIALDDSGLHKKNCGEFSITEGIEYTHATPSRILDENFFDKVKRNLAPYKNMHSIFEKIVESEDVHMLFMFGESYFLFNKMLTLAKRKNIYTVIDIVEHYEAMTNFRNVIASPILLDLLYGFRKIPTKVNLACCITTGLYSMFEPLCKNIYLLPGIENQNVKIVPSCEDSRFDVLYTGSLFQRDDPQKIIDLGSFLIDQNIDFKIHIVGRYRNNSVGSNWADKISKALSDCVIFHGELSDTELLELRSKVSSYLLPRKNEIQEIYSFPTRLIEYLKSGKLVIISNIGDVGKYLTHMDSAILLEEDNSTIFLDLVSIINNKEEYSKICHNGNLVGVNNFDRITHTKKLLEYADSI